MGRTLEGAALEDKRGYQQMYQEMIQFNGNDKHFLLSPHCKAVLLLFACMHALFSYTQLPLLCTQIA